MGMKGGEGRDDGVSGLGFDVAMVEWICMLEVANDRLYFLLVGYNNNVDVFPGRSCPRMPADL